MKSRTEQWIQKETRLTGKAELLLETIGRMVSIFCCFHFDRLQALTASNSRTIQFILLSIIFSFLSKINIKKKDNIEYYSHIS